MDTEKNTHCHTFWHESNLYVGIECFV